MAAKHDWPDYKPKAIEPRLQNAWEQAGLYLASETDPKPKYYCLDFFPYPSGDGLHVGHCRNYVPTDVISRYKRMCGFNVLHPMGWDAFGEPAEQYAARHGVHPRITTDQNTAYFRRQMTLIGTSYDWSREIDSSDPAFYHWTQYFFLLMFERGLAYRDTNWQWWCDGCQTTLSSHEVAEGVCWRGHATIYKREIPAWYFRITDYADELLDSLNEIDWPEPVKLMQRNWIGRSQGCEVVFKSESGRALPVFTTRPDTLFGVTYLVLAPEHPEVSELTSPGRTSEVEAYLAQASRQSDVDRMLEARPKTGVFTGGYVIHPLTGGRIPVWIADYVLPNYGTGAVMGVPAHDQRDFEFARQYDLPIQVVIEPYEGAPLRGEDWPAAFSGEGRMVNSGLFVGISSQEAGSKICAQLQESALGGPSVSYRMRDWLISRQRYWGTPIPILYCDECGIQPVPFDELPVLLPPLQDFKPDGSGRSPLARLPEFVNTRCPSCDGTARRETDTMGGFACSSWYFLRFTSPHYHEGPFKPEAMRYWMPVDLYVGGAEHAVLHLLYARFWTKVLADAGLLPFREPFAKLLNQGQLLGPDGYRMSKSRGNVITPDSVVESYGADALRIYALFMAPFDQDVAWTTDGINGARRFLNRIWNLYRETWEASRAAAGDDPELLHALHRTIRRVDERIRDLRLNTMVSTLMEFANLLLERHRSERWKTSVFHQSLEILLLLLGPPAPHISEELWRLTGHSGSVHKQNWPSFDEELAANREIELPVQVDGRLRDVVVIQADAGREESLDLALSLERVRQVLKTRQIQRFVYVPGKILNIVTRPSEDDLPEIYHQPGRDG